MAGLDFASLPHLHVSESKDHEYFTMNQAPPQTTRKDRRMAWNRGARKNLTESPKRINFHLSPTPTRTKTVTVKKSITDRQCTQKAATTFWTRMRPAKRVDPEWVHLFCGLDRRPENGPSFFDLANEYI